MTFDELPDRAITLLRRRGRLTSRAFKRQFNVDDAYMEDSKAELIQGHRLAVHEAGAVRVWTGGTASIAVPATAHTPVPAQAPLTCMPYHLAEKILAGGPALEGERKQVTVFFADLKDSSRLIEGLGLEAAQQLLDPAIHPMMAVVHRFEGTVNQVLGDGIMPLFGAPIAHEDYPLRACYVALAMQEAIRHYSTEVCRTHEVEVQICVGLNSGEVVVCAIDEDLQMDYSVIRQTTHLVARIDRMPPEDKRLLQTAAVIGTEVPGSCCRPSATSLSPRPARRSKPVPSCRRLSRCLRPWG